MNDLAFIEQRHHVRHDEILAQAARDRLVREARAATQARPADDARRQGTLRALLARLRTATNG